MCHRLPALFSAVLFFQGVVFAQALQQPATLPSYKIQQLTSGPQHHFFGYDGHVGTIPWSGEGRYILSLETTFHDRIPGGFDDPANIILIEAATGKITKVAETRAWNFQQGTMLYWNPLKPDEEFFFNDRRADNKAFTVLYNFKTKQRREFLFPDAPVANGGVAQRGGKFLALNYGRISRTVVAYPGSFNFSKGQGHPDNDGVWVVDAVTGRAKLIVSYQTIYERLKDRYPELSQPPSGKANQLFLNHTLWNRDDTRVWFIARWFRQGSNTTFYSALFTANADGSDLRELTEDIGHPDWEVGTRVLGGGFGRSEKTQGQPPYVIWDALKNEVVEFVGPKFLTKAGEPGFSPDLNWIATTEGSSNEKGKIRRVVLFSRQGDVGLKLPYYRNELPSSSQKDDALRLDMPPRWNRDGSKILFETLAEDRTVQLFVVHLSWDK